MLRPLLESALTLVFPAVCELCENPASSDMRYGLCGDCSPKVKKIIPPFCQKCGRTLPHSEMACSFCRHDVFYYDRLFACLAYEGAAKELLHHYKFNGRKHLKNFFSDLLCDWVKINLSADTFDAVLSVPLDPVRLTERGFNQAHLLSAALGKQLGLPDLSRFISRKRSAVSQWQLGKSERKKNVENIFLVLKPEALRGKKLLLLDDIVTTGHTASECARALKNAGAASVTVLAIARGLR